MEYTPRVRFFLIVVPVFLAIILMSALLYAAGNSTGTSFRRMGREFGTFAAWGLGATIVFALVNVVARRWQKIKEYLGSAGERLGQDFQRNLILQKRWIVDVHLATGIVGFLAALVHAYLLWQYANVWLILAMVLFAWMIVVGLLLKFTGLPPTARRYVYLMHSQWITVIALVVVTLIGHATIVRV